MHDTIRGVERPLFGTPNVKRQNSRQAHYPETPATQFLQRAGVEFSPHPYDYEERGGTRVSAEKLGVDEHIVVKTLIMENERAEPLVVLMHGDKKVSTKALARQIPCKSVTPCTPDTASRHSGYLVGGTSPFATRKKMPVYVERSILSLACVYINGGRRGFLVRIDPGALALVGAFPVDCSLDD